MTEFSKLKDMDRRPLRSFSILIITFLYTFGPIIMFWCYYNAILGSIPYIIISITQITLQMIASKSQWFIDLQKWSDQELYFNNFTFQSETEIKDNSKCLFGVHPHGIFSFALLMNIHRGHFGKNTVVCGSRILLLTPIMGLLTKLGGVQSVSPSNLKKVMSSGKNVAIIPGGFEEATITSNQENRVYIKGRKGFVKYAMKYGYSICPTFIFGEDQLYSTFDHLTPFRLFLNKLKIVSVIFCSRFGVFPEYKVDMHTVVGKPIQIPQNANPSVQDVNHYHEIYIESLKELYEKYSEIYKVKEHLKIF